jgi:hypothetical protein
MTNIAAIVLLFASLLRPACGCEDDPTAKPAGRVVVGRVLDSQGQPVRKGRVFFGPQEVRVPFTEESTASLDNDGRYRIDLKDFPFGEGTMPATGQLRFMVLSPEFRPELGKCEARPLKSWACTAKRLIPVSLTPVLVSEPQNWGGIVKPGGVSPRNLRVCHFSQPRQGDTELCQPRAVSRAMSPRWG